MAAKSYKFEAQVEQHSFDTFAYSVVYLPGYLAEQEPFSKLSRFRVIATVNRTPIEGAFQPGKGRKYLMLSKSFLKRSKLALGHEVEVEFTIDDPERVDTPRVLMSALSKEPELLELWNDLSAGKRRGLCYMVKKAKREATKSKRVAEILTDLRLEYDLFGS